MKDPAADNYRIMYHTQENRSPEKLRGPIKCDNMNAWLGPAYYYWDDRDDAIMWGNTSKRATGSFDIYKSRINCENVLNTVFNEDHYNFYKETIETIAERVNPRWKTNFPKRHELNQLIFKLNKWGGIPGLMWSDSPTPKVQRIGNSPTHQALAYRKRIQLGIFDLTIMETFEFALSQTCHNYMD